MPKSSSEYLKDGVQNIGGAAGGKPNSGDDVVRCRLQKWIQMKTGKNRV